MEYKNISNDPVTLDIYQIKRICDLEACKFFVEGQKGHSLVYKVDEFKAIETSNDGSYSDISGVVVDGHPFHVKVLWWTDDKMTGSGFLSKSCIRWIKKLVDGAQAQGEICPLYPCRPGHRRRERHGLNVY